MSRCRDAIPALQKRALCTAATAVVVIAGCSAALAAMDRPQVPAEKRYDSYSGELPGCADFWVSERIRTRFQARESEFWKSGLEIVRLDQPQEIGFRSNGLDYIPRRYCVAKAVMNDKAVREVSYSIEQDLGIIGWGFDVEWCIQGLDRNYAYEPNCKIARP